MNSGRRRNRTTLWATWALGALLVAATAAAWTALWARHRDEQAMKAVAIVVDGEELVGLVQGLLQRPEQLEPSVAPLEDVSAQVDGPQGPRVTGDHVAANRDPRGSDLDKAWEAALHRLREAGVTGVGVHERTLVDAARAGDVFLVTKASLEAMESPFALLLPTGLSGDALVVGWRSKADPWTVQALTGLLRHIAEPLPPSAFDDTSLWLLPDIHPSQIVLGLHPSDVERVRRAGLDVIPRIQGEAYETPEELERRLRILADAGPGGAAEHAAGAASGGIGPVLFKGTRIAGFPEHLLASGWALKDAAVLIGLIEFAPQHGLRELARLVDHRVVRVHSITDREMQAGIARDVAVDRWLRALRERQIRLLYVRLYPHASFDENLEYLTQLTTAVQAAGYVLGRPAPPTAPATPWWTLGLIALATGACAGWVAWTLIARALHPGMESGVISRSAAALADAEPDSSRLEVRNAGMASVLFLAGGALLALGAFSVVWLKGYTILARQGIALAAAISFPVVSILLAVRVATKVGSAGRRHDAKHSEAMREAAATIAAAAEDERDTPAPMISTTRSWEQRLTGAITGFLAAGILTLAGAALVATLLTEVRFLLKIEEFRGVKLAHLAPLAILALVLAAPGLGFERLFPKSSDERGPWFASLRWLLRSWMGRTIRVWELCAALAILAVIGVYLLRTGNQGLPVPALEESVRRWLEESFFARPRTKEFLIGHPALVAALACWNEVDAHRSRRTWRLGVYALLVLGAIGQISIINTFAHAHSALVVSLARTLYGAFFGLFLGVVAVVVLAWLERLFRPGRRNGVQRRASGVRARARTRGPGGPSRSG